MAECKKCGCRYDESELSYGICDECISKYENDIEGCFRLFAKEKETIEVNYFLVNLFGDDLEYVLLDFLKKDEKYASKLCQTFINADRDEFAGRIDDDIREEKELRRKHLNKKEN